MKTNLYLIGYRGSGKSTIAPLIATLAGCPWTDTDDEIARSAGKSIADIFADAGETEFRQLETIAIQQSAQQSVASGQRQVVSLGGGAITITANQRIVKSSGAAVYLRGTVETLWQRIAGDPHSATQRPQLTDLTGKQEVATVLAARSSIYESHSDFQIDIDTLPPETIAQQIFQWWQRSDSASPSFD